MSTDLMLNQSQSKRKKELMAIIRKGQETFLQVGMALAELKRDKLYIDTHGTFEKFCEDEFGMSRSYAHRIIESARVVKSVLPIGNKVIKSESVARPLTPLKVPERKKALKEAIAVADKEDRPVTARDVKDAVKAIPQRNKPDKVFDEIGREIPANLLPLWKRRNEAKVHLTALSNIKSAMKTAEELSDALYGKMHYQTFFTHIDAIYHDMKFAVPYALCGLCQGMKCKVCNNGLMNKLEWDQLVPEETRLRIERKVAGR